MNCAVVSSCLVGFWIVTGHAFAAQSPTAKSLSHPELPQSSPDQIRLLSDARFCLGFKLIEPTPGRKRVIRNLQPPDAIMEPKWYLCQWNSRHCLGSTPRVLLPSGRVRYANSAKSIVFGRGAGARLLLELNTPCATHSPVVLIGDIADEALGKSGLASQDHTVKCPKCGSINVYQLDTIRRRNLMVGK